MYEGKSLGGPMGPAQTATALARYSDAGMDAPVQVDSIFSTLMLLGQQSVELIQRSGQLADALGGPAPQSADKESSEPNSIMSHLRLISRRLSIALAETERAQRTIHQ